MRGTEKQIRWAEEIKTATLEAIDMLIEEGQQFVQQHKGNAKAEALLEKFRNQRKALLECEYAGDIIECFRNVKASDPVKTRCMQFDAACKINAANSPSQRKMLGR